jgi:hypothetical protein
MSQRYVLHLDIYKYQLFTLRMHTTILSKVGKVMYELIMLNSKPFGGAFISAICS